MHPFLIQVVGLTSTAPRTDAIRRKLETEKLEDLPCAADRIACELLVLDDVRLHVESFEPTSPGHIVCLDRLGQLTGAESASLPTEHERHVGRTTFQLSFGRLERDDAVDGIAIDLLARATCLPPGELIPRDLLIATLRASKFRFRTAVPCEEPPV